MSRISFRYPANRISHLRNPKRQLSSFASRAVLTAAGIYTPHTTNKKVGSQSLDRSNLERRQLMGCFIAGRKTVGGLLLVVFLFARICFSLPFLGGNRLLLLLSKSSGQSGVLDTTCGSKGRRRVLGCLLFFFSWFPHSRHLPRPPSLSILCSFFSFLSSLHDSLVFALLSTHSIYN